jgi:hypothetical protein
MISLLVVLFFALTGITLNHPEWTIGSSETTQTYLGTLPEGWQQDGQVSWLLVAEHLRATHRLKGRVDDTRADGTEASISFRAPAYAADAFIEQHSGSYSLKVTAQGPVGILNELHRGRDTGRPWVWLIDFSGGFLALVALSGLAMGLFIRKTRRVALLTTLAGTLLMLGLYLTTA